MQSLDEVPLLMPKSEVVPASSPKSDTKGSLKGGKRVENVVQHADLLGLDRDYLGVLDEECSALSSVLTGFMSVEAFGAVSDDDTFSYLEENTLSFTEDNKPPLGVGAGLDNMGNTCFMNAILQCITHTSPFVQALQSCNHGGCIGFCVLCALQKHITEALSTPASTIHPLILAENLNSISPNFEKGKQEDAHEYLQCLLSRLEECCLRSKSSKDDNMVEKIFGGSLRSRLKCCNCGHCSDTHERLIDLSLEIDNADTLVSALESFTKVEKIEDPDQILTCGGCKDKGSEEKQLLLEKSPSVAIIHLKRFKAHGGQVQKLSKHVEFPLELNMQPYHIGCPDNDANMKYNLYAVVVHKGVTSAAGHYYCYVRSSPDTWCHFNDWKVTSVPESYVLLEEAYILFYAKEGTPWISDLVKVHSDRKDLVTPSHSVLDETENASLPNSIGHKDLDTNSTRPNQLYLTGTRIGEAEVDQSRPPAATCDTTYSSSNSEGRVKRKRSGIEIAGSPETPEAMRLVKKHMPPASFVH